MPLIFVDCQFLFLTFAFSFNYDVVSSYQANWFPLTYHRPGSELPDNPKNIEMAGYKDCHHFSTVWRGEGVQKKLTALAYKSGTGKAVALTFSTMDDGAHWDMIPKKDSDYKWYFSLLAGEARKMKGFSMLLGNSSQACELLLLSNIMPRTCGADGQGSREWFLDRMFSGTSSTIAKLLDSSLQLLVGDRNLLAGDDELLESIRTLLLFGGNQNLLHQLEAAADCGEGMASNSNIEFATNNDSKTEAEKWLKDLSDPSGSNDLSFVEQMPSLSSETLCWLLALASGLEYKEIPNSQVQKKINKLMELEPSKRPFQNMTISKLKAFAKANDIVIPQGLNKQQLVDKIATTMANAEEEANDGNIINCSDNEQHLLPLVQFLDQSFLKPVDDDGREATRTGLKNEEPFIREFWHEYNLAREVAREGAMENNMMFEQVGVAEWTLGNLVVVYRPGLVQKKNNPFVKGSADGILITQWEREGQQEVSSTATYMTRTIITTFIFSFFVLCCFTEIAALSNRSQEPRRTWSYR